jgi:hypothetical protein
MTFAACMFGVQGTAFAQFGPGPEDPTGCTAPLITDWDDDANIDDAAGQLPRPVNPHAAPPDMNIISTSLKWTTAGGTPHLVASMDLVGLSGKPLDLNDSQGGNNYYVFFTTPDGVIRFVKAMNRTQDGVTFSYGKIAPLEAQNTKLFDVYETDGTTTGQMINGTPGHILIDVPADLVKLGDNLVEVFGNADGIVGYDDYYGLNNHIDQAPDGVDTFNPGGTTYKVAACA